MILNPKWCVVLTFFKELPYTLIGVYDENSVYILGSRKTRDAKQSHEIWNDVKILIGLTFVTYSADKFTKDYFFEVVINVFLVI